LDEVIDPKYFIDGFLIKYFNIFPVGFDKDNLFEQQKMFLVYLVGIIPSQEDWNIQMDYKIKLRDITTNTKIELNQSDIDVIRLQGRDINDVKKERLDSLKKQKIQELNKNFGIKEENEIQPRPEGVPEDSPNRMKIRQEKLWELLEGKGLVKTDGQ
jgi:hypothetical protein